MMEEETSLLEPKVLQACYCSHQTTLWVTERIFRFKAVLQALMVEVETFLSLLPMAQETVEAVILISQQVEAAEQV